MVQHALVDMQGTSRDSPAGPHFDETEMTQRAGRRNRAPMRVGQDREGEGEGGGILVRVARGGGATRGEAGVQLDACAQQQDVAFEGGKIEHGSESVDGWWC